MIDIEKLLVPPFDKKHISATLKHYVEMLSRFQRGEWEPAIGRSGKFVEAVLKALTVHTGSPAPSGRAFKADPIITGLQAKPQGSCHDSVRLVIPRACRLVYDIASNRGARHDPDEVDPNQMDAAAVAMNCSWILAEMLRISQKGALDMDQTQELVESLTQRRYPSKEVVDGKVYFHFKGLTAPEVAILALAHFYPKRISKDDLLNTITRHKFKPTNAAVALGRISRLYDDDGSGKLKALAPCLQRADEIMQSP